MKPVFCVPKLRQLIYQILRDGSPEGMNRFRVLQNRFLINFPPPIYFLQVQGVFPIKISTTPDDFKPVTLVCGLYHFVFTLQASRGVKIITKHSWQVFFISLTSSSVDQSYMFQRPGWIFFFFERGGWKSRTKLNSWCLIKCVVYEEESKSIATLYEQLRQSRKPYGPTP